MVNRLSNLAQFLEDESLPLWLKQQIQIRREEIQRAFEENRQVDFKGPNGESVTIAPRAVAAVA
jgi:hypothetical protein